MRPPTCGICDKDLDENEGGLVSFKKRFSDRVWERKMKRINGVGHPPYSEWFCRKHYQQAKDLKDQTIDKAMSVIRSKEKK
ncbi:MAG TPA: hypothetical protein VMZ29_05855 [Candidatus Bathyarchaeia archaeon]|nr:hypothetical protein [Candidatus Bathyarchaeia archaeon]